MYNGAAVLGVSRSSNGSTSLNGPIFEVGRDNGLNATYNVSDSFLTVRSDSTVINEDSQDYDFRVESNDNANMLFVDGGANKVGIGCSPTMPLSVQAASNAFAISMHGRSDGYSELYGASNDGSTKYAFLQTHSAQTKLYTLVNTPLLFGTNSAERMRIDSSGSLMVGGTAAGTVSGNNAMITVRRDSGNCGISYQSGTAATDQWETYSNLGARFYIENTSTSNGAYLVYNSSSGWVSISDERWKTDWTSLEDSSSKIAALSVGKYHILNDSKETIDGAKWDYGVKAQELLEVIPDAVDVPENPEDKHGVIPNIVFWHAVKAIQEQQTLIESLTARIAALEA